MNIKLIFQLSLFGLAMAFATLFWIPLNYEPFFWLIIFIICAYLIAKKCFEKYFLNGFLVSIVNCIWITAAHLIFFHTYIIHGLTATPTRRDGRHPIIFMHCGPIRCRADARKEAAKRPFEHYVIPRFTGFRTPFDRDEEDMSIEEFYSGIAKMAALRNDLIIDDVIRAHENGRNVLDSQPERTAHVELIAGKLREKIPDVITLTGREGSQRDQDCLGENRQNAGHQSVDTGCHRQIYRRRI